MTVIGRIFPKSTRPTKFHAKEDIVSAAHAFAVAVSDGDRAIESVKIRHADPTPVAPDSPATSEPSTSAQEPSAAGRENRRPEDASQTKKLTTIKFVAQAPAPTRRNRGRSIAIAVIALSCLAGGSLLAVKGVNLDIARNAYDRALSDLHRLAGLVQAEWDGIMRKAASTTEGNLEHEAATRRQDDEALYGVDQKPTLDAVRQTAEEAQVSAPETNKRQVAEGTPEAERNPAVQQSKSDAEIRNKAQSSEADLNLTEQDRKRVQASLSALGNQVPLTGYFGPTTRSMIAAWQKKQGLPETGFLDEPQLLALHEQATPIKRADQTKAPTPQQPEKAEAALNLSEQDRKKVQIALNALGHPMPSATGFFGPRTRAMIMAWQKSQGLPATGYLTETQVSTLWQQSAPALAKYNQVQQKPKQD